jgi:hypothetical protein
MPRSALAMLVSGTALTTAIAGCNLIFGVQAGEPGTGGSGGSTTSTSSSTTSTTSTTSTSSASTSTSATSSTSTGGACGMYDGDGTLKWSIVGSANIAPASFAASGSVAGGYSSNDGTTTLNVGGSASGFCSAGAEIHFAGPPVAGKQYTVVDRATFLGPTFTSGPNAFVMGGGAYPSDAGDCGPFMIFASVAGSGTVKVESVSGTSVSFSVTGVHADGVVDAAMSWDGQGTIQFDITAHADCFQMN